MQMKISELTGAALDWAVVKCEGYFEIDMAEVRNGVLRAHYFDKCSPSTDWALGGPIIEREHMEFDYDEATQIYTAANGIHAGQGRTHLIAAMRCYVANKLGDTVDIPEELL